MTRIDSYEDLTDKIVGWLKDYYWQHSMKAFVVGVSGGIDSAVSPLYVQEQVYPHTLCVCLLILNLQIQNFLMFIQKDLQKSMIM